MYTGTFGITCYKTSYHPPGKTDGKHLRILRYKSKAYSLISLDLNASNTSAILIATHQ